MPRARWSAANSNPASRCRRADHVLAQVSEGQLAEVRAPQDFGLAPIARIHIADYLDFLPGVLPARHLRAKRPGILLVSLGVDTYQADPISRFKLDSPDYLRMGARIAALGKPTLFVMKGGYAVAEIGINAVNLLEGFRGG